MPTLGNAATKMLEGLDEEQHRAVTVGSEPLCIVAGAGTGKTRTITRRVAYQVHTGAFGARETLAITHSRKAASELRTRFTELGVVGVQANTFHAAALRQLRHFWSYAGINTDGPRLLTTERRTFVRQAVASTTGVRAAAVPPETVLTVDNEITWAHAQLVSPARYASAALGGRRDPDVRLDHIAKAFAEYERLKGVRRVIDFDDVLLLTARLINTVPEVADAVRSVYSNFVVDEYQDTDRAQQELLDAWLGDRPSICAVGDPAQTIYSFKGADPQLLQRFSDRYPGSTRIELVRNYRSTPQVLGAANRLSRRLPGAVTLVSTSKAGPEPIVEAFAHDYGEAGGIAGLVEGFVADGVPLDEIAVLHRFNSQAPEIRAALTSSGVQVNVGADDEEYFTKREVAAAMRGLRDVSSSDPDAIGTISVSTVLANQGFDEDNPPAGIGAKRERWENMRALLEQARALAESGCVRSADLIVELDRRAALEHVPTTSTGVTVTTIHKAKGLEWDAVIVAKTTDGSLPAAMAKTAEQRAEERRLAYVAVTRARRVLVLTWSMTWGSNGYDTTPSPFHIDIASASEPTAPAFRLGADRQSPMRPEAAPRFRNPFRAFSPGARVQHDYLGTGTVVSVADTHLVVDFAGRKGHTIRLGEPMRLL